MSQVLYRKYRSQDFSQIFGQESVKKVLTEAVKEQKTAHAYLFTGPRGTGKTSMARILAKSLNCLDRQGADPCNKCVNCLAINELRFMDLIEIDAASNRGIDEIRDLKEKVGFLPVEGTFKVYIIDEVHMLTTEAFNALLKTLEEPPQNVVFILATTEAHKLPLTIISRTQRFDFKPASDEQLRSKLKYILENEGVSYEEEALDIIVNAAGGSFRDAESILEKIISSTGYRDDLVINAGDVGVILGLADSQYVEMLIDYVNNRDAENAFRIVQEASENGVDFIQYSKQLLLKARNELTKSVSGEGSRYTSRFLFVFIKEVLDAVEKLKSSLINTLPLEVAILNIIELSSKDGIKTTKSEASSSLVSKSKSSKGGGLGKSEKVQEKELQKIKPKTDNQGSGGVVERVSKKQSVVVEEGVADRNVTEYPDEVVVDFDFEGISTLWEKLVGKAKKANPHLAAILIKIVLKDYREGRLFIEVPFKFHRKQLESSRVNKAFQNLARDIYGSPLALDIEVNEVLVNTEAEEEDKNLSNVSIIDEVFGDLI